MFLFSLCLFNLTLNVYGTTGVRVEENSTLEDETVNVEVSSSNISPNQKYLNNEFIKYITEPLIEVPEFEFINFEKSVGDKGGDSLISKLDFYPLYSLLENVKLLEKPVKAKNTLLTTQEVVEEKVVSVNTFDINNYSDSDGPCELVDAVGEINIVKYYQMTDTISGEVIPLSYYAVCDTVGSIKITDEQKYNNFKLVDWFTSVDDWTPSNNELNTVYKYNDIKSVYNNGTLAGIGESELNLDILSDRTLHLLYNYEPVKYVFNVVKLDSNLNVIDTVTLNKRPDGNIYNCDLLGYSLDYYILSANDKANNITVDTLNSLGEKRELENNNLNINLSMDAKTLYLVYNKINQNTLLLYGNELSYPYSLSDLVGKENLLSVYDYVPSAFEGKAYAPECFGHLCGEEGCEILHKCFSHDYGSKRLSVLNNSWTVSVTDNYDYDKLTNYIKDYKISGRLSSSAITDFYGGNGEKAKVLPNAEFVFYRQTDLDKITLYPNKNNDEKVKTSLLSIGLDVEKDSSYRPLRKRAAQDTFTEESFYNTLITHWEDGAERDNSLSWEWKIWCDYGSEFASGEYKTNYENGHSPDDLNNYYSFTNNLQTNYYIGKSAKSNEQLEDVREIGGENLGYTSSFAGENLSFYPYYKMLYKDLSMKDSLEIYVTSENESSLRLFNSEQITKISVNRNMFKDNLVLNQIKFLGEFKNENIEPVEESEEKDIVTLEEFKFISNYKNYLYKILNESEILESINKNLNYNLFNILEYSNLYHSQIKVRIYRPAISEEMVEAVSSLGFKKTESEILEELNLKYEDFHALYLDQEKNNYTNNVSQYNISCDTNGYFMVKKDNDMIIKSNSLSDLLENDSVKLLDDNTKIITNLWNVLEHGENTSDRNGEPWYFEAFDGITVYVSDLNYYN